MVRFRVLLVCSDVETRKFLLRLIAESNLQAAIAKSTRDAISMLHGGAIFCVFCQDDLPHDGLNAVIGEARKVAAPVVVCYRSRRRETGNGLRNYSARYPWSGDSGVADIPGALLTKYPPSGVLVDVDWKPEWRIGRTT